jgi:hypothetical protein
MKTDDRLIADLRVEIVRLRAALAEAMEWGWADALPPAEVVARCETALGLTDDIPDVFPQVFRNSSERAGTPDTAEPVLKSA